VRPSSPLPRSARKHDSAIDSNTGRILLGTRQRGRGFWVLLRRDSASALAGSSQKADRGQGEPKLATLGRMTLLLHPATVFFGLLAGYWCVMVDENRSRSSRRGSRQTQLPARFHSGRFEVVCSAVFHRCSPPLVALGGALMSMRSAHRSAVIDCRSNRREGSFVPCGSGADSICDSIWLNAKTQRTLSAV